MKPVVWSSRAAKDLQTVTKFYINLYGLAKAQKIVTELRRSTELLGSSDMDTSQIGALDDSFAHLKRNYRKLIHQHCKITYREGETKIFIVRVFDTRQHPDKNK